MIVMAFRSLTKSTSKQSQTGKYFSIRLPVQSPQPNRVALQNQLSQLFNSHRTFTITWLDLFFCTAQFEMNRWKGKIAVVTGASSGIGEAIARDLHSEGMLVVALARREDRLEKIRASLPIERRSEFYIKLCDVTKEDQVISVFSFVEKELGGVDVLVNNAGIIKTTELVKPNNTAEIEETLNTNVLGVVFCTREAFNSMKARGIDGHVVIINSVSGHQTPNIPELPSLNIYPPTKHAVTSMTEVYRQEFLRHGTKIRITSVSPGAVDTEIFPDNLIDIIRASVPMLTAKDVSNAVLYALAAPPHVQIHEIVLKPIGEKM